TLPGLFSEATAQDFWQEADNGLYGGRVSSLAINSSGQIFAGTDGGGVYRSTDNGGSWTRINNGLTSLSVRCLATNSSGQIFAGTRGNGVYGSVKPSTGVKEMAGEIPGSFALEQNYPNPFNPSTTISFDVPKQSHLRLAIYDVLGREVKTLVDEEKNPGRYSVTFDASNLPSGVYLYRLEAGSFSEVRKMVESGSGDLF
ncbi:MAG: T9SS type A sorting domain-containing protein, partial [Bacteroidota bacterium]